MPTLSTLIHDESSLRTVTHRAFNPTQVLFSLEQRHTTCTFFRCTGERFTRCDVLRSADARWTTVRVASRRIESHIPVAEAYRTVFRSFSEAGYRGMPCSSRLRYTAANNSAISGHLIRARWRYAFNGDVDSGTSSSAVGHHHRRQQ